MNRIVGHCTLAEPAGEPRLDLRLQHGELLGPDAAIYPHVQDAALQGDRLAVRRDTLADHFGPDLQCPLPLEPLCERAVAQEALEQVADPRGIVHAWSSCNSSSRARSRCSTSVSSPVAHDPDLEFLPAVQRQHVIDPRGRDEELVLAVQPMLQSLGAHAIELAENVVEHHDGTFPRSLVEQFALGELERDRSRALLTLAAVTPQRPLLEDHLEAIAVRADQAMPHHPFAASRLPERRAECFGDPVPVVGIFEPSDRPADFQTEAPAVGREFRIGVARVFLEFTERTRAGAPAAEPRSAPARCPTRRVPHRVPDERDFSSRFFCATARRYSRSVRKYSAEQRLSV